MNTSFKGAAVRASEADIAVIAAELGVPYYRLRGVIEVEAPKGPFDKLGRPAMLFEPYWFYRLLPASKRAAAVKAGCAQASRPKKYPADSYPVLAKAMKIDEDAALRSCSWGRGQVMGFNFAYAGFDTVQDMVRQCMETEAAQLQAMAGFIKSNGLVKHLVSGNAAAFALGYNGSGYARDGYDVKIGKAWAKWMSRPVPTIGAPLSLFGGIKPDDAAAAAAAAAAGVLAAITDEDTVKFVQSRLRDLGYTEVGNADGKIGSLTDGAVRIFRADNGLPEGGQIDAVVLVALASAKPRQLSPARVNATAVEARKAAPEVRANWLAKIWSGATAAGAGAVAFGGGVLDNITAAKGYIDPIRDMLADVPPWAWAAVVAAIAGGIWFASRKGEAAGIAAIQTGARR